MSSTYGMRSSESRLSELALNALMNDGNKHYYIVRHGAFATSGEVKVAFTIIALLLCDKNPEYLSLFAVSSFLWASVECCLQLFGTRKIESMLFWGRTLPLPVSLALQGTQEAGFVCIYGIYFADRLTTHWKAMLYGNAAVLAIIMWNGRNKNIKRRASRRCITAPWPLALLAATCALNIAGLVYVEMERPLKMLFCMSILGGVWTAGQVASGLRGVETESGAATTGEMLAVLGFDVLIEMACAYLPFYFLVKVSNMA